MEWVDRLSEGLTRLTGGIDIVLLDLGLPDNEGLEAVAAIHAVEHAIPVVVLSGSDDEQLAVDAVQSGAQDYLVKTYLNRHLLARSLRYAIERKRADEARRESEERLRLAMAAATEAIWEFNPATGLARRNETYNWTANDPPRAGLVAEFWVDRVHADDQEHVWSSFLEALEGEAGSWSAEYRFLGADGEWRNIQDRAVIARDRFGKPTRVVGAMLDVTGLKRAQQALQQSNCRLHQLSRDLLRTQDLERRRIARELHDSTAQLLAALNINLSRLQDPSLDPDRRARVLAETSDLGAACSAEIRNVSYLLHPPLLDEFGLVGAIQSYASGLKQRTGVEVELKIPPDFGRFSRELEAAVFRVVQEGLANVTKHSGSPIAIIRLEQDQDEIRLMLEDRGRGLPGGLRWQSSGLVHFGVGIIGMRERAEQLGGQLEIDSNDSGTRLTLTLPLIKSNEETTHFVSR